MPVQEHDLALGIADEAEDAEVVKAGQGAGYGLQGQSEVVRDVAPRHWQGYDSCGG